MTNRAHRAVGIDLGTTFSAVAALDESGRPETIRNAEGDLTTPSVVFFDRKQAIIGVEAIEAGLHEPERLAQYAKRDIGEVAYRKQIGGETFPPEVVQALVLQKLKSDAELSLGPIEQAVVTVPAFFNEPCRKATQDAGVLAGLRVLDVINEPTAAAITYGMRHGFLTDTAESRKRETVLVYDLGGGTFDATVMEINRGSYTTIATAGDVYLGGIDWDHRIADLIADAFQRTHQIDPRQDPVGLQELMRKANQVKHALTQRESSLVAFAHEGNRLRMELSQQEFTEAAGDLVERTLLTTRMVMDEAGIGFDELTQLILVGGSSRMPMIRSELQQLTGLQANRSLSPDEAVCHGAALYAGILLKHEGEHLTNVSVRNANSHDLGVLAVNPSTGDPQRAIMIARNSRLPASREVRFRTFRNDQPNVKIHVVEGGDDAGKGATTLGKCFVNPLPPGTPKGTKIDVKFHYSQNGRLTVSACLPSLDRSVETEIQRESGLENDQLQIWKERIAGGLGMPDHRSDENSEPQASSPKRTTSDRISIDVSTVEQAVLPPPDVTTRQMDHAGDDTPSSHSANNAPSRDDPSRDDPSRDEPGGDDAALAAFLNSTESGCGSHNSDDSVVATTPLEIETLEPCNQSAPRRKKLKRVSREGGVERPSDWKNRRRRF